MKLKQTQLDDGVLKVVLEGTFDIAGAAEVEMPFSVISGKQNKVIVDLSGVTFLASMGVRVLVKSAKTIGSHGGKMALLNPTPAARRVLESIGVNQIMPVVDGETEALAAVS